MQKSVRQAVMLAADTVKGVLICFMLGSSCLLQKLRDAMMTTSILN
jgi:hypothetical protein